MQRIFLSSFLFGCTALVLAQGQGLEGDFNALSAKERSRIAKAEEEGASNDAQYQSIMAQAESSFREQRFDEALEQFIQARDLRPYNVYPRVKIQDLQALIARRDAALTEPAGELPSPAERSPQQEPVLPHRPFPETHAPSAPGRQVTTERVALPQERQPAERIAAPARPSETEGLGEEGERIYKEGRAVVVERTVVQEGRPVVFRKVTHAWGEVMYFKDGAAVPERVWQEAFGSR